MLTTTDLMLIFEPDTQSRELLRGVAGHLGCEHVETDSPQALHDVLAVRRPTIAVLAVDRAEPDGFSVVHALAEQKSRPATLLVGGMSARVLANVKRTAEARGLPVIGVATKPLDAPAIERLLTPCLSSAPPIPAVELERALVEHELTVQYQPKVALGSGEPKIQGVEALVRWQHPRRGLLPPGQFLDAFDEKGLMQRLTDFVMTEAVRQAGIWRSRGLSLEMTVNLSPRLVRDAAFPERLAMLLRENDFPPNQLVLDVEESHTPENRDLILDVFTRLRILGVGLSLDNFGTGVSSLTELYRMPFSEIKVDRALLADVPRERDARIIVRAITNLARTLQLTVCAEGVESWQMVQFARTSGFDTAQGRFFSDAVNAADVEDLVRSWPSAGPASPISWRPMKATDPDLLEATSRLQLLSFAQVRTAK
jgi:EAL domain-containing protein (putative c-di-GMP-specific phosphodiesterase class I)